MNVKRKKYLVNPTVKIKLKEALENHLKTKRDDNELLDIYFNHFIDTLKYINEELL